LARRWRRIIDRGEIESQLAARLDQAIALPQEDFASLDDHRQLRQRAVRVRYVTRQGRQFLFDGGGRGAGGEQFGQASGGGHLAEVEIRQSPHFTDRHNQTAPMPATDHRHRNAEQLGQHRRRVKTADLLFGLDEAKTLPKLRLADDLDPAVVDGLPRGGIERGVKLVPVGHGIGLADHDQIDVRGGPVGHHSAVLAEQRGGVAPRHAGQSADERYPPPFDIAARVATIHPFSANGNSLGSRFLVHGVRRLGRRDRLVRFCAR
jgi:hypothetical protein